MNTPVNSEVHHLSRTVTYVIVVAVLVAAAALTLGALSSSDPSDASTSGTTGGCTWTLDDSGNLNISADSAGENPGRMPDYDDVGPWGSGVKKLIIHKDVLNVGGNAFSGCTALASVTFEGDCIAGSIGNGAFEGCSSLASITIPGHVTSIGESAFKGCTSLASVSVPSSVTSLGTDAFRGCNAITKISFGSFTLGSDISVGDVFGLTFVIDDVSFGYDAEMVSELAGRSFAASGDGTLRHYEGTIGYCYYVHTGDAKTSLFIFGKGAMDDYYRSGSAPWGTSVTSVVIDEGVTSVGRCAFTDCTALESASIPATVWQIWEDAFKNCTALTSVTFADDCNLGFIRSGSFEGCKSLERIDIPSSVSHVWDGAFMDCTALREVTGGAGLSEISDNTFKGCESLESFTIGDKVKTIGEYAFYECHALRSVDIPEGVTFIDYGAFMECRSIESLYIPASVNSIGGGAFSGCSNLTTVSFAQGSSVDVISAFSGCSNLTTVNLPASLKTISLFAFSGCSALTTVTLGDGSVLETIDYGAFGGCSALRSFEFPASLKTIDKYAFIDCCNLTFIGFGDGSVLETIGYSAFEGCTSITSMTFPASLKTIGDYAFTGLSLKTLNGDAIQITAANLAGHSFAGSNRTLYQVDGTTGNCTWFLDYGTGTLTVSGSGAMEDYKAGKTVWSKMVKTVRIGAGVTHIGTYAFYNCPVLTSVSFEDDSVLGSVGTEAFHRCTALRSVTVPDSVTSIGESAFADCSSLTSVRIGNGLTSIGSGMFSGCSSLTSVSIGDAVTSIGTEAFKNCSSLTSVMFGGGVRTIGTWAFNNCTSLTSLNLPASVSAIEDYAFYGCSGLNSVSFVNGSVLETIGTQAFYDCTSLTSFDFPSALKTIGWYSFGNAGLTSVTIPASVETIGDKAFFCCRALTSIRIGDDVTYIGRSAFALGYPGSVTECSVYGCSEGMLDRYAGLFTKFTYMTHTLTVAYAGCGKTIDAHVERVDAGTTYSVASPVVEGYSCDEPVVTGVMPSTDVSVTVVYTLDTYTLTVIYKGCPEESMTKAEFAYGYSYSIPTPEVEGYTPDVKTVSGIMPAHDVTVTVTYKAGTYTVSWDGVVETCVYGSHVSAPATPSRDGYVFAGWDPEVPETMPAEDLEFEAVWASTYTLTVIYAGCPNPPAAHTERLAAGAAYSVTSPAVEGYTCDEPVVTGVMPAYNLVQTVVYTVNTYTLTVTYTGYTSPISDYTAEVAFGAEYSVDSPERRGFTPDQEVVSGVMPAHDVKVTVTYKDSRLKVTVEVGARDSAIGLLDGGSAAVVLYAVHGDSITVDGNVLTVGDQTVTASARAASDADVTNSFTGFTIPGGVDVVTSDMTITAVFDAVLTGVTPDRTGAFAVRSDATYLDVPAAVLKQIREKCTSFTVTTSVATVSFDKAAISKIIGAGVLSTTLLEKSQYPEAVKNAYAVISVDFGGNHDFTGGKVSVTLPVTASGDIAVGYVHDGKVDRMDAGYDVVDRTVTFTTDHLSDYAVLDAGYFSSKTLDDNARLIVTALTVFAILAFLSVYLYRTSKTE